MRPVLVVFGLGKLLTQCLLDSSLKRDPSRGTPADTSFCKYNGLMHIIHVALGACEPYTRIATY